MSHVQGRTEGFGWGNLKKEATCKGLDIEERIILKWMLKKQDGRAGLLWLSIGTSDRLL